MIAYRRFTGNLAATCEDCLGLGGTIWCLALTPIFTMSEQVILVYIRSFFFL